MATQARGPATAWLLAALVAVVVALALRDSFLGMAFQWRSSSTFSYGVLIFPITLYLLWRERARLAAVQPGPSWLAVLFMVPVGVAWILGMLLDVNVVHHFAAVLLVILSVWAVLGTPAVRVIWFPLGYLLFMVPFGEFLVPTLMEWTADFAVLAVAWSGVPVFQDGFVFSLPGGDFEVIKACSGIRFLMATVAAGTVFAWVAYRSRRKRLLFLLACLVVPVIGNLLRAYLVVMLVHLSDGQLAGDHVLYGTLFYGAILLALFVVGARHADATPPPSGHRAPLAMASGVARLVPVAVLAVSATLAAVALPGELRQRAVGRVASELPALPATLVGYAAPVGTVADWQPVLRGATRESIAHYQPLDSAWPVDAFVAVYDRAPGRGELTDSRNRLFDLRAWRRAGGRTGAGYTEELLRPAPRSAVPEGAARVVWAWYVVDGETTDSRLGAKLLELKALLTGQPFQQGLVALSTAYEGESADARRELGEFAVSFCAAAGLPCPAALGNPAMSSE